MEDIEGQEINEIQMHDEKNKKINKRELIKYSHHIIVVTFNHATE